MYKEESEILGFIGLGEDNYTAGLFVDPGRQSEEIGRQLTGDGRQRYDRLELDVYVKNTRAVRFYLKNGFAAVGETINEETKEPEYRMIRIKKEEE